MLFRLHRWLRRNLAGPRLFELSLKVERDTGHIENSGSVHTAMRHRMSNQRAKLPVLGVLLASSASLRSTPVELLNLLVSLLTAGGLPGGSSAGSISLCMCTLLA
jgi:hypothetical protein